MRERGVCECAGVWVCDCLREGEREGDSMRETEKGRQYTYCTALRTTLRKNEKQKK